MKNPLIIPPSQDAESAVTESSYPFCLRAVAQSLEAGNAGTITLFDIQSLSLALVPAPSLAVNNPPTIAPSQDTLGFISSAWILFLL